MISAEQCYLVFQKSIEDYHVSDDVDQPIKNPFIAGSFEALLYGKNWIDTVQWHLEDIIRKPDMNPAEGIGIKRRIDKSNQERTDTVERIDDFFLNMFKHVKFQQGARINSETPAWLLDRMSILLLKIYHMKEQTERRDVTAVHISNCMEKLTLLEEQKKDMQTAFDELIDDIRSGIRRFKVYRQMKMYNDASLNPMLYNTLRSGE
jgi:ribosome-associated translation inhibitor RaiA